MSVSTEQYQRVLRRLTTIEESLNNTFVAIDKFVTLGQVNQLLTILQQDLADVKQRIEALESRVDAIENEPMA